MKPGEKLVATTYRNAYGTHFECSSTCVLLLEMYAVLVVGGLLLLFLIPVRSGTMDQSEAPFVLWFGSPQKKEQVAEEQQAEEQSEKKPIRPESYCNRFRLCVGHCLFPSVNTELRDQFQADLRAASAYESIPEPPLKKSRSSVFRSPRSLRQSVRFTSAGSKRSPRAASVGNVTTSEQLVHALARRQAIEERLQRRQEIAQEDKAYENLADEEIQTYEHLEFVREMLDGISLKKICQKSGRIVPRTLYVTPDFSTVFWNRTGTMKRMTRKSSLRTIMVEQVVKGLRGSANVMAKSSSQRDILCVSIGSSDGKWLVLLARDVPMCQRLFLGFSRYAVDNRAEREAEAKAVKEMQAREPEELLEVEEEK